MRRIREMLLASILAIIFLGCSRVGHWSHVRTEVDTTVSPKSSDKIFFQFPDNPTIKERNIGAVIKTELERNGFNVVGDINSSLWILTFAVDRRSYSIGTNGRINDLTGRFYARDVQKTDVTTIMHLLRTSEINSSKPTVYWEGSVSAAEKAVTVLPNSVIKNLLDAFGTNFDKSVKLDGNYQALAK